MLDQSCLEDRLLEWGSIVPDIQSLHVVELAELDLRLLPPDGEVDLGDRDAMLEKIFSDRCYTLPEMPPPKSGLASPSRFDRLATDIF